MDKLSALCFLLPPLPESWHSRVEGRIERHLVYLSAPRQDQIVDICDLQTAFMFNNLINCCW